MADVPGVVVAVVIGALDPAAEDVVGAPAPEVLTIAGVPLAEAVVVVLVADDAAPPEVTAGAVVVAVVAAVLEETRFSPSIVSVTNDIRNFSQL